QRSGERQRPVCLIAKELRTGHTWRMWRDELLASTRPPFPIGPDALIVAYYASAEMGTFRALNWPKPCNVLDLFTEFRCRTNGLPTLAGSGLVGALVHFGLDSIDAQEKDELRLRILGGGPWAVKDEAIVAYCASDVDALERLLPTMAPGI